MSTPDWTQLAQHIRGWAAELGLQQLGITDTDLGEAEQYLARWLTLGRQADMEYMRRHGHKRTRPAQLVPGTIRVISVRMDYWPGPAADAQAVLDAPEQAYIARYALGRDYHKLMRSRLQRLAHRIEQTTGAYGYRVFCDSAPVMERALAEKAGLGWIGKHTCLIERKSGSWFFLGELYTDLPLPIDAPGSEHCGSCSACIQACPTGAIVGPWELDARRCIAYWTIEHIGAIPEPFRPLIGNRVFGCDDCQIVCPWNRFAKPSAEADFRPRHQLDNRSLIDLFAWSETEFLSRTEGMPIRRLGHERWLRNIAIGLGNAPADAEAVAALNTRRAHPSEIVREHVEWALQRQRQARTRPIQYNCRQPRSTK